MTSNDLRGFAIQCGDCEYWHLYMSWEPLGVSYTHDTVDSELWFVPAVIFDTEKEAHIWFEAQVIIHEPTDAELKELH